MIEANACVIHAAEVQSVTNSVLFLDLYPTFPKETLQKVARF